MRITISGKNIDITDGLRQAVEDKLSKLERYFTPETDIVVTLSVEKERQKIEVTIPVKEGREKEFLRNTISDISHQLKTPLAALNIYNGILQGEAEDLPTVREFAGLSEQELERIETLIQNLLKISKFDAGTIVMEKKRENVSEMMERVRKRFDFRAVQEGKKIVLAGDESSDFVCDCSWLSEAIANIVKNALDHTEEGEFVRIEWKTSAFLLQIAVEDNGSGIHPEDLYFIFKP